MFHPTLGAWMTPDPLDYVDGGNRQQYEKGNPLNGVDPMGLQKRVIVKIETSIDETGDVMLYGYGGAYGHAFMTLEDTDKPKSAQTVGFYPSTWYGMVLPTSGMIMNCSFHIYNVWKEWILDDCQYDRIDSFIKLQKKFPSEYNPSSYNCADWVITALYVAGIATSMKGYKADYSLNPIKNYIYYNSPASFAEYLITWEVGTHWWPTRTSIGEILSGNTVVARPINPDPISFPISKIPTTQVNQSTNNPVLINPQNPIYEIPSVGQIFSNPWTL